MGLDLTRLTLPQACGARSGCPARYPYRSQHHVIVHPELSSPVAESAGMNLWERHGLTEMVVDVLGQVPSHNTGPHFGRPYVSAYQLAIGLHERYRTTVDEIGKPVGGAGIGQRDSLAQYLAQVLSTKISQEGAAFPVEGAFLSNIRVKSMTFHVPSEGEEFTSSLVGAGIDMSLFRLRSYTV